MQELTNTLLHAIILQTQYILCQYVYNNNYITLYKELCEYSTVIGGLDEFYVSPHAQTLSWLLLVTIHNEYIG